MLQTRRGFGRQRRPLLGPQAPEGQESCGLRRRPRSAVRRGRRRGRRPGDPRTRPHSPGASVPPRGRPGGPAPRKGQVRRGTRETHTLLPEKAGSSAQARLKLRAHWAGQSTFTPVNYAARNEALPPSRKDAQICAALPTPGLLLPCATTTESEYYPGDFQNLLPSPMHLFPYEHKSGVLVLSPGHNS